jgi:hypothetical protein
VLKHVISGHPGPSPVHFLSLDGDASMCGRADMFVLRKGTKLQRLFPTGQPVTCIACRKSLELVVRHTMTRIASPQDMEALFRQAFRYAQNGTVSGQG